MDWIIWNELKVILPENVIMQIDNYTQKIQGEMTLALMQNLCIFFIKCVTNLLSKSFKGIKEVIKQMV